MSRPFVDDHRPSRYQSPWGEQRGGQYRALCADGVVRTATATGEADTMFTVPARVVVRGRTVTGHVYVRGTFDERAPLYRFSPSAWLRNAAALPPWPEAA